MSPAHPAAEPEPATVHGGVVLVGARGILVRGPSGSGKSRLAMAIVERVRAAGGFAAIVADDRVILVPTAGRLVARAPARLAGLVELRGRGLMAIDGEPAAVVRHVFDFEPEVARLPEDAELETTVCGIRLPRTPLRIGDPAADLVALHALRGRFA